MSIVKKIFNTIFTVLLISLLTLTGAIPTLAGNKTSESQSTINLSYDATSQNDLQRLVIVEKRVCRYIDGKKRCWNE